MSDPRTQVVHVHPAGALVALVGNPNCGKTALFNLLTGSRQKVANYAGVTVERKEGRATLPSGRVVRVLDLPGTYSLFPRALDERVTVDVLAGRAAGEKRPDLVVCVLDATNLRRGLRLVLAVRRLGLPCMVALNKSDAAAARGLQVDAAALSAELGLPVVTTIAIRRDGAGTLVQALDRKDTWTRPMVAGREGLPEAASATPETDHAVVAGILHRLKLDTLVPDLRSDRIDRVVLHPVVGPLLLAIVLFVVFQSVFTWAELPTRAIEAAVAWTGEQASTRLPEGVLRSLVVDGVIAGLGAVIVFLPQIVILFFFILVLEDSGYLPRAAFLLDRIMGSVGLSGRSFIPLLSSFACAVPGIMAARSIGSTRDRWVTIMIAPLMTCSARLPVYALLISAFVPRREVLGGLELQGIVLFVLYIAGIVSAMMVAWLLTRVGHVQGARTLMMELPTYHWPTARAIALGLWQRAMIFLSRVGTTILVLTLVMWLLSSFPAPPPGASGPAIEHSIAGAIGHALAVVLAPIGFNWQISLALVPGLAAREVAVSALGTVYALTTTGDQAVALASVIAEQWAPATGYALLAWYIFAPQCLSTLVAVRRELGSWTAPVVMLAYLFVLAYGAAWVTFRVVQGWVG
jgi:ferrous iron transport protein B